MVALPYSRENPVFALYSTRVPPSRPMPTRSSSSRAFIKFSYTCLALVLGFVYPNPVDMAPALRAGRESTWAPGSAALGRAWHVVALALPHRALALPAAVAHDVGAAVRGGLYNI